MVTATVREWHDELGWGVLDSPQTPGGCWAHFSAIETPVVFQEPGLIARKYASLVAGDTVNLQWESAKQDGFDYRAVKVWKQVTPGMTAPLAQ